MSELAHVLLTRYNLPTAGMESRIRAKEGWLRQRTELFERYTVPSVRAQTARDVSWIVYLDPESPAWLLDRMESLRQEGLLTPTLREEVTRESLVADLHEITGRDRGDLITTNLDNDDGLALDFAERVQRVPLGARRHLAIYLAHGLITHGSAVYLRRDRHNAFCSVREDLAAPLTCWADWHNRLALHLPVAVVGGRPAWLQVIHGTNVSNRVRGRRVSPARYRDSFFQGALDEVTAPAPSEIVREIAVNAPYRFLRNEARGAARIVAVKALGKTGFDSLKERLSHVRRT